MSWPDNDPSLHELRRKWDEGHFRQDADSVYGIDEVIDEAIEEITKNDNPPRGFGEGQTLTGIVPSIWEVQEITRNQIEFMEHHMDQPFGAGTKICRICHLTAHNDPCDTCYSRWRRASQTPSEAGVCVFCQNKSPSVICVLCVNRVLKDGL